MDELKLLVEKKRHGRERRKMLRLEDEVAAPADMESSSMRPLSKAVADGGLDHPLSGALRSSWLQRRSKESTVDVRIVDDDVNIKLTARKKADCFLRVARVLDELRLDVVHAAGGSIGVHYVFMLNAKVRAYVRIRILN